MKNKAIILLAISIYTFIIIPLLNTAVVFAENNSFDIIAPTITLNIPVDAVTANRKISIKAKITDNGEVREAILYYRSNGEQKYNSINMVKGQEDEFVAEIPETVVQIPKVDYYMTVTDDAGNQTLKGFSTNPLTITVNRRAPSNNQAIVITNREPADEQKKTQNDEDDEKLAELNKLLNPEKDKKEKWYGKWWVYTIAVGVLGGAALALAGGDNSREDTTTSPSAGDPAVEDVSISW